MYLWEKRPGSGYFRSDTASSPDTSFPRRILRILSSSGERQEDIAASSSYLSAMASRQNSFPASVSLATETAGNVITVPSSAISEDNNGKYVLVADNGSASRRSVETGLSDGRRTAILSGIEEGDSIIISGSASDGSAVSIVEES